MRVRRLSFPIIEVDDKTGDVAGKRSQRSGVRAIGWVLRGRHKCLVCNGSGEVVCQKCDGKGSFVCRYCSGSGVAEICRKCAGWGWWIAGVAAEEESIEASGVHIAKEKVWLSVHPVVEQVENNEL